MINHIIFISDSPATAIIIVVAVSILVISLMVLLIDGRNNHR